MLSPRVPPCSWTSLPHLRDAIVVRLSHTLEAVQLVRGRPFRQPQYAVLFLHWFKLVMVTPWKRTQERAALQQGQGCSISGDLYCLSGSCGIDPWVGPSLLAGGTLICIEDWKLSKASSGLYFGSGGLWGPRPWSSDEGNPCHSQSTYRQ